MKCNNKALHSGTLIPAPSIYEGLSTQLNVRIILVSIHTYSETHTLKCIARDPGRLGLKDIKQQGKRKLVSHAVQQYISHTLVEVLIKKTI